MNQPKQNSRLLRLIKKAFYSYQKKGFRGTVKKVKETLLRRWRIRRPLYRKSALKRQRQYRFDRRVKFSIVVPLYNTPEKFLHEMIRSVLDQTYTDWELCMADGSSLENGRVEEICKSYMEKDRRIRYRRLKKNMGISGNTNACLAMATGDYIGLFDHDDILHPAALFEVMQVICQKNADFIYTDENTFHKRLRDAFCPHFKPDFSPDTLRSYNYICHFTVFRRALLEKTGVFRSEYDGSQDYDMILRLTEQAENIVHIPKILYFWRAHKNSVAESAGNKPYVVAAAHRALEDHLRRVGLQGEVLDAAVSTVYRIKYEITGNPFVSIVIPTCDHADELRTCLDSIFQKTDYTNYEIVLIENNSKNPETFAYYDQLRAERQNLKIVTYKGGFNYSAINNFGIRHAKGDYFLLLNNDTEVINGGWLREMLMFAQRSDVGAVGAMLYYPDDTIQHAGVIIGLGGVAGHSHKYFRRGEKGYSCRLTLAQNLSAVTAACMLIRRDVWEKIEGLDESFAVAFNDVDLCMRICQAGYRIVWTPYAELYHYESKSRGAETTPEKQKRFQGEINRFQKRWAKQLAAGDPYYNPNLTLDREDFSIR